MVKVGNCGTTEVGKSLVKLGLGAIFTGKTAAVWEVKKGQIAKKVVCSDGSDYVVFSDQSKELPGEFFIQSNVLLIFLKNKINGSGKGKSRMILIPGCSAYGFLEDDAKIKKVLATTKKEKKFLGMYTEAKTKTLYYVEKISLTEKELFDVWDVLVPLGKNMPLALASIHSKEIVLLVKCGLELSEYRAFLSINNSHGTKIDDLASIIILDATII